MAVRRQATYSTRFTPPAMRMQFMLPEGGYGEAERQAGGDPIRGLVFLQGDLHKQNRSIAMQSLANKETKIRIEKVVAEAAAKLVQRWAGADPAKLATGISINLETQRFATDVIGEIAFSHNFGQLETDFSEQDKPARFTAETNKLLVAMIDVILKDPLELWRFFDTAPKKAAAASVKYLREFEGQ
eukprot:scaffold648001_cov39-Prasinocladus_malaysianus.AAC.1